ncbi:MAG: PQQ-like beta-propeller repeat protein [Nitrospiraceae bacterium]
MRNWLTVFRILPVLVLLTAPAWAGPTLAPVLATQTKTESVHEGAMPARVVAVGFGYQQGSTSLIRIRTYDAGTGDPLSEERFELNVVGEDPKKSDTSGDRVFAGAAYLDSQTISEFPMRVYDARSGGYLWQGNLNFVTPGSGDPRQQTGAGGLRPSRRLRLIRDATLSTVESSLIVQAVDRLSGQPVWRQTFTPRKDQSERVASESQTDRNETESDNRDYEVIVRSYDRETEELIWTDRLSTRDEVEGVAADEPERAQLIPGWPVRQSRPGKLWAWNIGAMDDHRGAACERPTRWLCLSVR